MPARRLVMVPLAEFEQLEADARAWREHQQQERGVEPEPFPAWHNSPIYQDDNHEWWFWDETWANKHGPFESHDAATAALSEYVRTELGGG